MYIISFIFQGEVDCGFRRKEDRSVTKNEINKYLDGRVNNEKKLIVLIYRPIYFLGI